MQHHNSTPRGTNHRLCTSGPAEPLVASRTGIRVTSRNEMISDSLHGPEAMCVMTTMDAWLEPCAYSRVSHRYCSPAAG